MVKDKPWLEIPGATTEAELDWLHEKAKGKKFIYEIGSFLGRSTVAMLESGAHVTAVDDFYGARDESWTDEQRGKFALAFVVNTHGYKNLHVMYCDHARFIPVKECDMVFIDGDHAYENVKRDILRFKDHKGILICGHDYKWWPSVKRAVDEIFGDKVQVNGNLWYIEQ